MAHPKVKLSDDSGNAVSVTSNRLDVNAHLAASPTIDIGDVSLLLGGTAASVNNGASDATTLRVTIASDTTGVLSVDDNGSTLSIDDGGGSITIDGTVTANLSAVDNSALDKLAVPIYEDDADWTDGTSSHMLVGGLYQSSMQTVTDGDVAPFQVDSNGVLKVLGKTEGYRSISHGSNTDVGTSAEALSSSQTCKHVDIMAAIANTGIIYVGGSGVTAATGIALYAGDTYSVNINNLDSIYVLASVNGEDVQWVYYE